MPENERFVYYLTNPQGQQFGGLQYACGRCIPMKTQELNGDAVKERTTVPQIYEDAFAGDESW